MDMYCRKCREPWDWFYIRDEVLEDQQLYEKMEKSGGYVAEDEWENYDPQARAMRSLTKSRSAKIMTDKEAQEISSWQFSPGPHILQCPACIGEKVELTDKQKERSSIESAMADILGDDIDGMMAEMEDFDAFFGE